MKIVMMIVAACLFAGCKDIPYQERERTLSLEESPVQNIAPIESSEKSAQPVASKVDIANPELPVIDKTPSRPNGDTDNNRRRPVTDDKDTPEAILPKIEITSPTNNAVIANKQIEIVGAIDRPDSIKDFKIHYQGLSENNKTISGSQTLDLNTNLKANIGDLLDGNYRMTFIFKDLDGNEHSLPELNISIDQTGPKIIGALDGLPQLPYLQETANFHHRLIDIESNPRYVIEPAGEAVQINWKEKPMIQRWATKINDRTTAPKYRFLAEDKDQVAEVRFAISKECAHLEQAGEIAQIEDQAYEISIVPGMTNLDLTHDAEEQELCLSIWVIDRAGNASNHTVRFIWNLVTPPIVVDVNAALYSASQRKDDVMWRGYRVQNLFNNNLPIELKKNLVIAHAIIANPFETDFSARLELTKSLDLKINERKYQIPQTSVSIRYFGYDLQNTEIGQEKIPKDGFITIGSHETVIAKFILRKEFPIRGVKNPKRSFWRSFSMELGFTKSGEEFPLVDGLKLITNYPDHASGENEFTVPWGNSHEIRRRSEETQR